MKVSIHSIFTIITLLIFGIFSLATSEGEEFNTLDLEISREKSKIKLRNNESRSLNDFSITIENVDTIFNNVQIDTIFRERFRVELFSINGGEEKTFNFNEFLDLKGVFPPDSISKIEVIVRGDCPTGILTNCTITEFLD